MKHSTCGPLGLPHSKCWESQNTKGKSTGGYVHTHTGCKVCWLFQSSGRAGIRPYIAKISWRKTQTLHTEFGETTESQLPRTKCTKQTPHTCYHQLSPYIQRVEDLSLDLIATTIQVRTSALIQV